MMGRSPHCYTYQISWKSACQFQRRYLKGFYYIWAWRPSWSCDQHHVIKILISLYLKAFIQNLVQNGIVVSEKIQFDFFYVHDLGPRSRNNLELQYSHTFIDSIRCLRLPTFRSLAAILSEKSTVFTFSHKNAYVTKFDLGVN